LLALLLFLLFATVVVACAFVMAMSAMTNFLGFRRGCQPQEAGCPHLFYD